MHSLEARMIATYETMVKSLTNGGISDLCSLTGEPSYMNGPLYSVSRQPNRVLI